MLCENHSTCSMCVSQIWSDVRWSDLGMANTVLCGVMYRIIYYDTQNMTHENDFVIMFLVTFLHKLKYEYDGMKGVILMLFLQIWIFLSTLVLLFLKLRCCVEQSGCHISDQSSDLPLKLKIAPRTAPPDHIIFINAALWQGHINLILSMYRRETKYLWQRLAFITDVGWCSKHWHFAYVYIYRIAGIFTPVRICQILATKPSERFLHSCIRK